MHKRACVVAMGVISLMGFECSAIPKEFRDKGFVYLHEIDPTIMVSLRYATAENFVGAPIDGYKKPVVIMTKQAARALKKVQKAVSKDGYCLVVYDAYRPQHAVDHFVRWGNDQQDLAKKAYYYPRIDKAQVFDLGYVARRSGHSKGNRVDLTIIKKGAKLHEVVPVQRTLLDGYTITFLDDGTVDMGSSFDMFDLASHTDSPVIARQYKQWRSYLKSVMEKHGFENYHDEWWHFTLQEGPFAVDLADGRYFDFAID